MFDKSYDIMRYLKNVATRADYASLTGNTDEYRYPNTTFIDEGESVEYNKYEATPLTFQIIGDSDWEEGDTYEIFLFNDSSKKIKVRVNDGEWVEYPFSEGGETEKSTITGLTPGDLVQFESDVPQTYSFESSSSFRCNTKFNVFGNLNSLNAYSNTLDDDNYCYLFEEMSVVSAKNLILPATTLAEYCYSNMFWNCRSLISTPEILPATTLANYCYYSMFYNCASLTSTPELPATTLANYCYSSMFWGCTSLTQAPALPATTLAQGCYERIFYGCTSLTTAPALPATTLANYCYDDMFMNCTSLTQAPALPATTLTSNCYRYMFRNCTSLNYIKAMFTTTPSTTYTNNWVSGVAANGTFVKNSAAQWDVRGVNGIPNNWTVETASE